MGIKFGFSSYYLQKIHRSINGRSSLTSVNEPLVLKINRVVILYHGLSGLVCYS